MVSAAPPGLRIDSSGFPGFRYGLWPLRFTLGYNPSSLRDWNPHLLGRPFYYGSASSSLDVSCQGSHSLFEGTYAAASETLNSMNCEGEVRVWQTPRIG